MRLARKIHLGNWNYFCTFTYDDKKHTEEASKELAELFQKALSPKGLDLYRGMGAFPRAATIALSRSVLRAANAG